MTTWVEALDSGKYKQCKGELFNGDGYCCLGVLLDVGGVEFVWDDEFCGYVDEVYHAHATLSAEDVSKYALNTIVTDDEVRKIANYLDITVPEFEDKIVAHSRDSILMTLNDELGANFNQIAYIIDVLGWDTTEVE